MFVVVLAITYFFVGSLGTIFLDRLGELGESALLSLSRSAAALFVGAIEGVVLALLSWSAHQIRHWLRPSHAELTRREVSKGKSAENNLSLIALLLTGIPVGIVSAAMGAAILPAIALARGAGGMTGLVQLLDHAGVFASGPPPPPFDLLAALAIPIDALFILAIVGLVAGALIHGGLATASIAVAREVGSESVESGVDAALDNSEPPSLAESDAILAAAGDWRENTRYLKWLESTGPITWSAIAASAHAYEEHLRERGAGNLPRRVGGLITRARLMVRAQHSRKDFTRSESIARAGRGWEIARATSRGARQGLVLGVAVAVVEVHLDVLAAGVVNNNEVTLRGLVLLFALDSFVAIVAATAVRVLAVLLGGPKHILDVARQACLALGEVLIVIFSLALVGVVLGVLGSIFSCGESGPLPFVP
jgi:hypothetical protein